VLLLSFICGLGSGYEAKLHPSSLQSEHLSHALSKVIESTLLDPVVVFGDFGSKDPE
jgi:hypothetical protein